MDDLTAQNLPDGGGAGPLRLLHAEAVIDAAGVDARPGALLARGDVIVAVGRPEQVGHPAGARLERWPGHVLIPALVNAHCHLDLTHLGTHPFEGEFTGWIEMVRRGRCADDAAIAGSVRAGAALCRAGGTALVGDIAGAGSIAAFEALRSSGLGGVSFLEVFGLGRGAAAAIERMRRAVTGMAPRAGGVRLGLQPHAPYSCGLAVYRAAAALSAETGAPLATHLAETPEERRFLRAGDGPIAAFLDQLGLLEEAGPAPGVHPVDHLAPALAAARWLTAHCNDVEPRHLGDLARWGVAVVYCPRASAYFGHPREGASPHRYLAMRAAGVTVALGTDALLCLDTPDRISVLDEMRLLHRRDGTAPRVLLEMATIAGAAALGIDPAPLALRAGATLGVLALAAPGRGAGADPLAAALLDDTPPRWAIGPVDADAVGACASGAAP